MHDITSGNNGAYQAGPGWDPCTGLGSPDGQQLVTVLNKRPPRRGRGRPAALRNPELRRTALALYPCSFPAL